MTRLKSFIERLRRRIELAAKSKDPAPFFSIETVLLVLSVIYGGLMCLRARLYEKGVLPSKTLPCRVVSIGNIIAGGMGKTPMTILVARMIRDLGYRVVVISRGYRGLLENKGGVVSDGRKIFKGPEEAGDEPYLMARILKDVPVVVGKRRYDVGMMAVAQFKPDVIVFDDAFQHLRLKRDLNLVLLDSRWPCGNGNLLPRGVLREPVSALHRAHAIIFTRSEPAHMPPIGHRLQKHRPVFYTTHNLIIRNIQRNDNRFVEETLDIAILKGQKAVAFAGLADNDQFFESLEQAGCMLMHTFSFADHHRYDGSDWVRIAAMAEYKGADRVVTTAKDFVKIETLKPLPVALVVIDVSIRLTADEGRFIDTLMAKLSPYKG